MNFARLSSVLAITSAVLAPLSASAILPVKSELEIRRPVVDPKGARTGSPALPILRPGLGHLTEKLATPASLDLFSKKALSLDHAALGGVAAATLKSQRLVVLEDGRSFADYLQTYRGLDVVDSAVHVRFRRGEHVLTTSIVFPDIAISTTPVIDGARAESVASARLAEAGVTGLSLESASELVVYPQGDATGAIRYRLAFRNRVRSASPAGNWETIVAADGSDELLYRHNNVAYAVGQIQVQVEPRYIGQTPVAIAAPGHTFGGKTTDGDGIWETAAGAATVPNAGPFFNVNDQAATDRTKSITVAGSGFEQFTWMANTEAPLEELDPFVYAHTSHERQFNFVAPDVQWFAQTLPINTNVSGTCNAYYDGASLNFFPTGGGCNATSRIADVIYHEYGHGIHDHLCGGLGGQNSEIQEGVADIFAHEITDDPNLGPNFFPGQMAGIRNATDVRTYPSGVQGNNSEVHESGKIWTNTFWLLRVEMKRKMGAVLGSHAFDLLHANTLRANPIYTTSYAETIAADDDDGNPANGTPNSCEINKIFTDHGLLMGTAAATRGYLVLSHTMPATTAQFYNAAATDIPVTVTIDSKSPTCGGVDTSSVTLHYKINGGAEQTAPMTGSGTSFSGAIPGQADKSVVTYWFTAKEDAQGASFSAPLAAPFNAYTLYVGPLNSVFADDFESDQGWTHGADVASHDDWERGTPAGNWFDPSSAHSGTNVIGNDIGVRGGNGLYEANMQNWIESPSIDCSACKGARLQFWRSLDVGAGDAAKIEINGTVVWTSESAGRLDGAWTFVDLDISSAADAQGALKIRFDLTSDAKGMRSGWTIDDVAVMAESGGVPPGSTPPPAGLAGDSLNGGCKCNVADTRAPSSSTLALALVVAALVVARRRRV